MIDNGVVRTETISPAPASVATIDTGATRMERVGPAPASVATIDPTAVQSDAEIRRNAAVKAREFAAIEAAIPKAAEAVKAADQAYQEAAVRLTDARNYHAYIVGYAEQLRRECHSAILRDAAVARTVDPDQAKAQAVRAPISQIWPKPGGAWDQQIGAALPKPGGMMHEAMLRASPGWEEGKQLAEETAKQIERHRAKAAEPAAEQSQPSGEVAAEGK